MSIYQNYNLINNVGIKKNKKQKHKREKGENNK